MVKESIEAKLAKYGFELRYSIAESARAEGENLVFVPHRRSILDIVEKDGNPYVKAEDAATGKVGFSRKDGNDAFGGLHEEVINFEEINGKAYLRAGNDDQQALYDVDGNEFGGRTFDKIKRKKTSVIEGGVFLVEYDGKQGFILGDESMFGLENAMHEKADLKKIGEEACLWGVDDGKECYYTKEGQELYGGKQPEIRIIRIGDEFCSIATDEEKGQCIFSRENEELYKGWHHRVGSPRIVPAPDGTDIFLVDVYDLLGDGEEAVEGLVLLDREGNKHFGDYHESFLEGPSIDGSQESPSKEGMHMIDNEVFFAFKEFNGKICLFRYDNMPAFGGPHDRLCYPSEDNKVGPLVLSATALKFRDGKKIGYFFSDGTSLFGGQHEEEVSSFEWKGITYILFKDVGRFGFFEPSGENVFGEYHDKICQFRRVSFERPNESGGTDHIDELFLEALDPVPFMSLRRIKNFLRTPSTYYNLAGEVFPSLDAIREYYVIPSDVQFEALKTADTIMMRAVGRRKDDLSSILGRETGEVQEGATTQEEEPASDQGEEILPLAEEESVQESEESASEQSDGEEAVPSDEEPVQEEEPTEPES